MKFWDDWCAGVLPVHGEWEDLALRSLMTLKGLTYGPTGGIVAARDDIAPRIPRGRAQLGLPLLLGP